MNNQERSGSNYLDPSQSHQWMALQCLTLIQPLKENICGIPGQLSNAKIGMSTIKEHIPDGLAYACIYWPFHTSQTILVEGNIPSNMCIVLEQFFDNKVLQWIECMSLLQQLNTANEGLQKLKFWGKVSFLLQAIMKSNDSLLVK
jgi:hypothetical protein